MAFELLLWADDVLGKLERTGKDSLNFSEEELPMIVVRAAANADWKLGSEVIAANVSGCNWLDEFKMLFFWR